MAEAPSREIWESAILNLDPQAWGDAASLPALFITAYCLFIVGLKYMGRKKHSGGKRSRDRRRRRQARQHTPSIAGRTPKRERPRSADGRVSADQFDNERINALLQGVVRSLGLRYDASPILGSFDVDAGIFSLNNAWHLARCSEMAYKDEVAIRWELSRSGFSTSPMEIFSDKDTGTDGYMFAYSGNVVIAFRGTHEIGDWVTNLKFRREYLGSGDGAMWIHYGFCMALESVWEKVEAFVDREVATCKRLNGPIRVWLTGHSLGGALAAMAALKLLLRADADALEIAGLYTFGQPRAGGRDFCKFMEERLGGKYIRLVNSSDPVPLAPPHLLGYKTCGHEKYINSRGQLLDHQNALQVCVDRTIHYATFLVEYMIYHTMRRLFPASFKRSLIEDHGCSRYVTLLKYHVDGQRPPITSLWKLVAILIVVLLIDAIVPFPIIRTLVDLIVPG